MGHSSAEAPAAEAKTADTKPVEIRREKPVSLLERLGLKRDKTEEKKEEKKTEAVKEAAPETKPAEAAAAPIPDFAPVPEAAPAPQQAEIISLPEVQEEAPPLPEKTIAAIPVPVEPQAAIAPAPAPEVTASAAVTGAGPVWHGAKGQTLRAVLKQWSDTAGVDLYWSIDYDYKLEGALDVSGTYDQAVAKILDKFAAAKPRPYGQLHQPGGGAKVLVIKSYDLAG